MSRYMIKPTLYHKGDQNLVYTVQKETLEDQAQHFHPILKFNIRTSSFYQFTCLFYSNLNQNGLKYIICCFALGCI
jgi:hypothetical protein